jgi:hypothetical protein
MPTAQNGRLNDAGSTTRYGAEVAGGRAWPDGVERAQVGDHTACAVERKRGRVAFAVLLRRRDVARFVGNNVSSSFCLSTTVLAIYCYI